MNSSDYLKLNLPELTDKYSLENENENWQAIDSFASTTNSALEDISGGVVEISYDTDLGSCKKANRLYYTSNGLSAVNGVDISDVGYGEENNFIGYVRYISDNNWLIMSYDGTYKGVYYLSYSVDDEGDVTTTITPIVDTEVTEDSTNAVASGAVYTALQAKADTFTTDTTVTSGSSNLVTSGAVYSALEEKATIETGSLPSNNYAWYADDTTKTLTGTYEIIGDYIFITGTAYTISGWGVVYYTLPKTPLGACAATSFESDTNYTIQTNTLTSSGTTYPVAQIRRTDGENMSESVAIMFTMMYKIS